MDDKSLGSSQSSGERHESSRGPFRGQYKPYQILMVFSLAHRAHRETFMSHELITPEQPSPGCGRDHIVTYPRCFSQIEGRRVYRTRVYLSLTYDEFPDVYTKVYTRSPRARRSPPRSSLRYRMATPSRTLRPRSTLATRRLPLPTPGRAHPANSTFPLRSLYIAFPFTEHKKKRNGRR